MAVPLEGVQANAAGAASRSDDSSIGARVHREWDLFGGGLSKGLDATLQDRLIDHPELTAVELLGAGVAGYALARAGGSEKVLWKLGAQVASASLMFSFLRDVNVKAGEVWQAASDTWSSPANFEHNQDVIARSVTPFLFDTAVTMVPGMFGAKFGSIVNYTEGIKAPLVGPARGSVFRIEGPDFVQGGERLHWSGSGFAVSSDGKIGTAFHVADRSMKFNLKNVIGMRLSAKPIAGLPREDVALLEAELEPNMQLKPLTLAKSSLTGKPVEGAAIGTPAGRSLTIRTGMLENVPSAGGKSFSYETKQGMLTVEPPARWVKGAGASGGMSGGPVMTRNGEVIATVMADNGDLAGNWFHDNAINSPVEYMNKLIDMTERAKVPGAAVSLDEAATRLQLSPQAVLDRINAGTLDGFTVPSGEAPNTQHVIWDWRVLLDRQH
jgi:S1-C subfamily serine protease